MSEVKKTPTQAAPKPATAKPAVTKAGAEKPSAAKATPAVKPAAAPKPMVKPATAPKSAVKVAAKRDLSGKNRLQVKYINEVVPALMEKYGFKNVMAVPKIEKVVLNIGLGDCKDDSKKFDGAVEEIALITGQKPIVTRAKKSISNFKLRENQKIGAKVTLRGRTMYEFLDKLITIALPRVRDFRGISPTSFDKRGNYALGIKEQLVFPEISYEKIDKVRGFDICIVTTAQNNDDAYALLLEMGFPFRKTAGRGN